MPAKDGWEQIGQVVYVTPTAESRLVLAVARRFGVTWYITLLDGKSAAIDRRGAQIGAAIDSFRVPGMKRESFAGKKANELDPARLKIFADFVEEARTAVNIPGAAVAIVHGGKIVFEKGFGVRVLGSKAPVTPSTRFMIGSTTKPLTSLMMARLIDAGKFTWETPVIALMPMFGLGDAATTARVTMQNTVCACTGMPRRDLEFLFEYDGISAESRIASMKSMQPTTGFGETFQYSNLMVAAGGYAAALASGRKGSFDTVYDATMKAEVFAPLAMTSTTLFTRIALTGEHALPHGQGLSLLYEKIPMRMEGAVEAVRPAGAAWSTVRDLARYLELELSAGKIDGKTVVSEENVLRRRAPQIKIFEDTAYGLGLIVETDHGVKIVHHGGNTIGFTSDLFLLPEHDLGVVVLSNAGSANIFTRVLRRRFLEILFDGKATAGEDLTASLARAQTGLDATRSLIKPTPDAAWMTKLVGKYRNADLGALELRRQGNGYVLDAGEWSGAVTQETARDNTEKLIVISAPYAGFELVPRQRGDQTSLVLDGGQVRYEFAPVAK